MWCVVVGGTGVSGIGVDVESVVESDAGTAATVENAASAVSVDEASGSSRCSKILGTSTISTNLSPTSLGNASHVLRALASNPHP